MENIIEKSPKELIEAFGKNADDSGASEVQIAILTMRIQVLSEHFKVNAKDHHSRFGLIKMVNKRKKLLAYLKKTKQESYLALISKLGLRK